MRDFNADIEAIKNCSPLELPNLIQEIELHDQQSACEIFDQICQSFEKDGMVDNVVTPVITTIIDGILTLPCFKGLHKTGLTAQRVVSECKAFNYEGKFSYLVPECDGLEVNLHKQYDRTLYANQYAMDKYKKMKVTENGTRKNMPDEYRMTQDITARKDNPDARRNDPKNEHNAETDHIVPLKTVFGQLQNNAALSDGDIKRIANQDYNFAVTGRMVNNPKRDMSNSEFIALQDQLKKEGKPYVELTDDQRSNMIKMEVAAQASIDKETNKVVLDNLIGRGQADRKERKEAHEEYAKKLGKEKLTQEEAQKVDEQLAKQKALSIHGNNAKEAGKQTLFHILGNVLMLGIKPIFYEIKDGIVNGFKEGVGVDSYSDAFKVRFKRVWNYIKAQIKSLFTDLGSLVDIIKDFVSSLIEGIIGMFVGVLKQAIKLIKEGVKVVAQIGSVLVGEKSKTMTANEKGDFIVKILGGAVVTVCGVGIDLLLQKIPVLNDSLRGVISSILSGLAGILLFYVLDKADLFNTKREQRENRIKEVFDLRIQEIKKKTEIFSEATNEALRKSYLRVSESLSVIEKSYANNDFVSLNSALDKLHLTLFPKEVNKPKNWNC